MSSSQNTYFTRSSSLTSQATKKTKEPPLCHRISRCAMHLIFVTTTTSIHGDDDSHKGKPPSHGHLPVLNAPKTLVDSVHAVPVPELAKDQGAAAEYTFTKKLTGRFLPVVPNTSHCTGAAWTSGPCAIRVRIPLKTGTQVNWLAMIAIDASLLFGHSFVRWCPVLSL